MNIKEFEQHLQSLENQRKPHEMLITIFDFLSNNPSGEEQEVLEQWLMVYSTSDPSRVANYWKPQLENGSFIRQSKAATFLGVLAKRNITAREILREFLQTIPPDADVLLQGLKQRYSEYLNE